MQGKDGSGIKDGATEKAEATNEYLTFTLGEEYYGVNILRVQELRGWETATRVPNTPGHLQGVVNLRGDIVPVYDLRQWFGMPTRKYSRETVVIVVRTVSGGSERSLGMVVDGVSDVLMLRDDEIGPTPAFDSSVPAEYITGLAKRGSDMIMLLDLDMLADSNHIGRDRESKSTVSRIAAAPV